MTLLVVSGPQRQHVLDFEEANFPNWTRWFQWQDRGIGTAMVVRASELLRDAGTRLCHIGWTVRESFYARAGYRPWRRYAMFRLDLGLPAQHLATETPGIGQGSSAKRPYQSAGAAPICTFCAAFTISP